MSLPRFLQHGQEPLHTRHVEAQDLGDAFADGDEQACAELPEWPECQ
jgi:hypothetical protein